MLDRAKVLVVDDDRDIQKITELHLHHEGFEVVKAFTGLECLEVVKEDRPDIILLDLMMPEMDGFEFLTYLRQSDKGKDIPVVVVTAKAVTAADRERLSGQVGRIFHKGSFTRAELIAELRRVLVTGRPAPPGGERE